ncbi:hypothetical protein KAR91_56705 [Candidatus Pacearchaeota archaeon]|nr:hypothetical protein [Candidatus Pacearchaeota archaeon]
MSKRAQLVQQVKEGASSASLSALIQLTDLMIGECHLANESNTGEAISITQGEIKACRKIQSLLLKQKK